MKKCFLSLILIFFAKIALAAPLFINKIVFFGDSLTDDGRLYHYLLQQVPKSPPYYKGRFSNGPTWAENIGAYYYDKYYIGYKSYALGAATAIYHRPTTKFISTTNLDLQLNSYLADTLFRDKSKTLFFIWIGSNDYLYYDKDDPEKLTNEIVAKIIYATKKLLKQGVQNFVILNLPDASLTPFVKTDDDRQRLHHLVMLHNQKLATELNKLKDEFQQAKIVLFDIYGIFSDFMTNIDVYNKKYNTHISNMKEACWKGGFISDRWLLDNKLEADLQQSLQKIAAVTPTNKEADQTENIDIHSIMTLIKENPELKYVYSMGRESEWGLVPCSNPDEHLFWDSLHPTAAVHRVLASIVVEQISKPIFGEDFKA